MRELSVNGKLYFDKMFDEDVVNSSPQEVNSLEEITSLIEFTINLPKRFQTESVRNKYTSIINLTYLKYKDMFENEPVYYYELCKSGATHVHGVFRLARDKKFFIHGCVQDIVRFMLSLVDKRLKPCIDKHYYVNYARYKSPLLCVQHSYDIEREKIWTRYILKSQ